MVARSHEENSGNLSTRTSSRSFTKSYSVRWGEYLTRLRVGFGGNSITNIRQEARGKRQKAKGKRQQRVLNVEF
jgi:hypothetical protein